MFPRGTILITIAANIGYTRILEFNSTCTDSLVAIRPTQGDSAEFLNYYLQTQQPVMADLPLKAHRRTSTSSSSSRGRSRCHRRKSRL
jgi:hypothetical protein